MNRMHDKIREILETRHGLTQKGLAQCMGLNPAAVNRMLHGRRNIMADEIPLIEKYIGQKLLESPAPLAPAPVPVYGGRFFEKTIIDWTQRHPAQAGINDAFAIYTPSDDMTPRYFKGELAYIHPHRPPEPGRDCLLVLTGGEMRLRRLVTQDARGLRVARYHPAGEETLNSHDIFAVYTVVGRS